MKLSTIIGVLFYCLINSAEAIVNYGRAADGFRLSGAATTLRSVNIGECGSYTSHSQITTYLTQASISPFSNLWETSH